MGRTAALILAALASASVGAQEPSIEATTATGEKVRLLANGRWEYADPAKAEPQRKAREVESERERTAQGGWLGFGRKVYEGDKDYNRGTLNPAKR
jgi:hypothetical protein